VGEGGEPPWINRFWLIGGLNTLEKKREKAQQHPIEREKRECTVRDFVDITELIKGNLGGTGLNNGKPGNLFNQRGEGRGANV